MLALDWAENAKEEVRQFKFVFLISLRHVDSDQPLEQVILDQHGRLRTEQVSFNEIKTMGMLALDWVENTKEELKQFKFVVLISLRHVDSDQPLEQVILDQHGRLRIEKVTPSEIKNILKQDKGQRILLLMDGYDEYTYGCNKDIDNILLHGKGNCLVILSSRPGDYLKDIKTQTDEEVKITGLSYENIIKCAEQYLASEKSCQEFLVQAEKAGIHTCQKPGHNLFFYYKGLLHVPIILLMACTIFLENHCLPSSKTGIFSQVVHMCVSRTTLKTMGKTASEVENLHELILKLGKLAWAALTRERKQLLLYKVNKA